MAGQDRLNGEGLEGEAWGGWGAGHLGTERKKVV